MLIKIINTTYGHRPILPNGQKSHYVIPVRPGNPPIEVEQAEGERLIALGVAAEVTPEKITAPKTEAPEEASEAKTEGTALEDMSFNDLKALAQENGIDIAGIRSKAGLIEAITAAQDPEDGFPALDAQDVID